jgi:hypothetical protein
MVSEASPDFVSQKGLYTIFLATKAFPVTLGELDTLRYQVLPNRHNRTTPIRSYKREDVRRLACRKHAMLAGLHKQGLSDEELLTQGEGLWNTL